MGNISGTGTPKLKMVGTVAHLIPASGGETWNYGIVTSINKSRFGFGDFILNNIPSDVLAVLTSSAYKWTGTATAAGKPATVVLKQYGDEWRFRVILGSEHGLYSTTAIPVVVTATYQGSGVTPVEPDPDPDDPAVPVEPEPSPEEKGRKTLGIVMVVAGIIAIIALSRR